MQVTTVTRMCAGEWQRSTYGECPGGRSVWQCAAEQTVTFTVTKGAAVFTMKRAQISGRMRAFGMAEVDLSSTVADASTVEAKINQSSDSKR